MIRRLICIGLLCCLACLARADEPAAASAEGEASSPPVSLPTDTDTETDTDASAEKAGPFELSAEVRDVLLPLFSSIANADVSRATVEMSAESKMDAAVLESQTSTYQVASLSPNQFTVYLKEPEQRTRIFCDGQSMVVALGSDAYLTLPEPISNQDAVTSLPVPLGPYPELVLALTMAGVDPAISLLGGMKSIEILDREPFDSDVPAVHLRGVQSDAVTWDLWISTEQTPRPLRMAVDLTPMLAASQQVQIPAGYAYQLRFDFLGWRVSGDIDKSLFRYSPSESAKEYRSLEEYYQAIAGLVSEHPLLGKETPAFEGMMLSGKKISNEDLSGKVIVLDFWATWCAPCVASLPIIQQITDEYADKNVLFFALNTGEEAEEVEQFLKDKELELNVILDPDGTIASAFTADAIPQTILIGKDGVIESAHIGFVGEVALRQRLHDELDVLAVGGKIASAEAINEANAAKETAADPRGNKP